MIAAVHLLLTWLIAGVPTGILVAALAADVDPRTVGSGNTGATNVRRAAGDAAGAWTLAGDALKGFVPVALAAWLLPGSAVAAWAALLAFAGHCWSPYLGFRGGKGVATSAGALLALAPLPTLLAVAVWVAVVAATRRSSLGALAAAALLPFLVAWLAPAALPVTLALAVGVVLRHRANIQRLLAGAEG